jgi:hypothetical protein
MYFNMPYIKLFIYRVWIYLFIYLLVVHLNTAPTDEMIGYLWFRNVALEAVVAYFKIYLGICL